MKMRGGRLEGKLILEAAVCLFLQREWKKVKRRYVVYIKIIFDSAPDSP